MPLGIDAGAGLALGAASLFGINDRKNDKRQIDQQRKLNQMSIEGSKELADYNNDLMMKNWHDTNYSAQVEELKKAGMSVSSLYGGGGTGGSTASAGGGSVNSGTASDSASTKQADIAEGMAIAQMANITANTEKTKAETANLGGSTEGIIQDNRIKTVNAENVEKLRDELRDAMLGVAKSQTVQGVVDDQTQQEKIQQAKNQTVISNLEKQVSEGKINLTKAQIKEIGAKIAQGWKGLEFQGVDKVTGKYLEELAQAVKGLIK